MVFRMLVVILTVLGVGSCAPAVNSSGGAANRPAPTSTDLAGRAVDPFAGAGDRKATVLLFVTDTCPVSNSYAPEVRRLAESYGPRGVAFYLVYADADLSGEEARKHHDDFGYPCPGLLDPKHELVRRAGASVTPEAAVFLPSGRRVYLGRIDDRPIAYAQSRVTATSHDLRDVLDSVVRAEPVTPRVTKAIGCHIPD